MVPAYGLVFAPHPTDYVWWNDASTVIAGWLAEMGVEVKGLGLIAYWQVEVEVGMGSAASGSHQPDRVGVTFTAEGLKN